MKILIVSQFFYPESFRINNLAEALVQRGHDVTVLTGQPNYPSGRIFSDYSNFSRWSDEYASMRVLRVPVFPRRRGGALALAANYLSFIVSATIFGLPRVPRSDVCLIWSSSPIFSALPAVVNRFLRRVPTAIWIQDLWPESFTAITGSKSPMALAVLRRIVRFIYRRCDQIWIQSPAFSKSVETNGGRAEKIKYLPNWAEDFYDRDAPPASTQTPAEKLEGFSILFAGNLGKAQALPTLVAAAKALRDEKRLKWYFVGDGSMRGWLEHARVFEKLESQIEILPARLPKEMPGVFSQATVLLASLTDDPTFELTVPSKIQSYLAAGKPILASMNGEGARLISESGCGLVAGAQDAIGLVDRIKKLLILSDDDLREMGKRSYEVYDQNFRTNRLIDNANDYLNSLRLEKS